MKFKKIVALLLVCCLFMMGIPDFSILVNAEEDEYTEGTYENLTYRKYADYVEISGLADPDVTEVVIPAEIDSLPVTSIGESAFALSGLASIIIPKSMTSIGAGAFSTCCLTSVTIPESVTSIESLHLGSVPN